MFAEIAKWGGPVFWVILGCGVFAFVVFLERALHLHRARIKSDDFLKGLFNVLKRPNVNEALSICEETPGPVAHLARTAILHRNRSREEIREALEDGSTAEISRMERRLVIIATVAQIAPLLGLLGTVVGMIESLLAVNHHAPLVHSVDIMGGMLRALTTTAAGLIVAVPCYVAFNLLVIKIDRIVLDMEKASSEMLAFISDWSRGFHNGSNT